MPTPLTDAINALTRYANETTGQSDTTLSDAVETLVSGYGQGGGDSYELARQIADGSLTEYVDDTITKLRAQAFTDCYDLETVICHNVAYIGSAIFGDGRAENSITPLLSVAFPKLGEIPQYRMQNCKKMKALDLTACANIARNAFETSWWFDTLILRNQSLVTLAMTNAFNNTPFGGRGGRTADLYVPSALISSYQSANNWSTILSNGYTTIHAIEGSPYENHYVDGTLFGDWEIVRSILSSEIKYGYSNATNAPYYTQVSTRASYAAFDIPIEYGYTYMFDAGSTYSSAQMGLQFYNQNVLDKVANNQSLQSADIYDPGWQPLETTYTPPQYINGSPIRGVRFAFRQATDNPTVTSGFISSITVYRKAV